MDPETLRLEILRARLRELTAKREKNEKEIEKLANKLPNSEGECLCSPSELIHHKVIYGSYVPEIERICLVCGGRL